ncbi:cupin-like domain-containing protein [Oscillatoria sp. FACHB-1407]|uniref:cupin-like domain-containing protein n=1 Tax=Oscillatoria sp. FACHB-1407 TaxID=2692847 RepID=UPI0016880B21|nr:cupin-like domain-containing protein [Oscillatoria sp. FACHB-1407]MBD2463902.1 cupin-like domain-containing protein [Oscillatoria sp. FACHB-1407]
MQDQGLLGKPSFEIALPKERLQRLVNRAVETLETILEDESLSVQERVQIASRVLEVEQADPNSDQSNPAIASAPIANNSVAQSWKRAIAESKFHGQSDEEVLRDLLAKGADHVVAAQLIKEIESDPCYQAGHNFVQLLRKLESMLEVEHKLTRLAPQARTIERRSHISKEEFLEKYYATNTPVIITDMMHDWKAIETWTPEYFKAQFGEVEVEVQSGREQNSQYEIKKERHKKKIRFADYVDMVTRGGDTNDYYMVATNRTMDKPEFQVLLNDLKPLPDFLNSNIPQGSVKLWFGPGGTITPVHHDQSNVLAAHVCGRKRWRLISPHQTPKIYNYHYYFSKVDLDNPDYEKYPLFKDVDVLDVVLKPGELIFVPVGWWHYVKALDVSISLSFMNFAFQNGFKYKNPDISTWWQA